MRGKLIIGLCAGALAAALAIAGGMSGGGQVVAVTTVPTVITNLTVDVVEVDNITGSDIAWVMINASGTAVSNAAAAGTAMPIQAGAKFLFDTRDKDAVRGKISSVAIVTTNATATAYVRWF